MAKKKEGAEKSAPVITSLMDSLINDFKSSTIASETTLLEKEASIEVPGMYLPIPQLQNVYSETGGKIPYGSIVLIDGWESSGKSTMGWIFIMAELMMNQYSIGHFNDADRSGFGYTLAQAFGVNQNRCLITKPSCGEKAIGATVRVLKHVAEYRKQPQFEGKPEHEKPHAICVIDSLAALFPGAIAEDTDESKAGTQKAALASLMSSTLPLLKYYVAESGAILVLLTQLRTGFSFGRPAWTESVGGNAVKFWCDSRMRMARKEILKVGDEQVGTRTAITNMKNKFGAPMRSVEVVFGWGNGPYDLGVDMFNELLQFGLSCKLIDRAGSWYTITLPDMPPIKFQGLIKMKSILVNNRPALEALTIGVGLSNYTAFIMAKADSYKSRGLDTLDDSAVTVENGEYMAAIPSMSASSMIAEDVSDTVLNSMGIDRKETSPTGAKDMREDLKK